MKKLFILKLLLVLCMFLVWFYFYDKLPQTIPTHWWYDWRPDNMWDKLLHLVMFPFITLWLVLLFSFLPRLDPKKENYPKFEKTWEVFQFSLIWFFMYIYFVSIYAWFHQDLNMNKFMLSWIWVLFIILGNYMWKIRQNYFIWIKLPWTLANEEVWNKTHRLWWKMFMLAWLIFIINAFVQIYVFALIWILLTLVLFVPVIYSYFSYKKITNAK